MTEGEPAHSRKDDPQEEMDKAVNAIRERIAELWKFLSKEGHGTALIFIVTFCYAVFAALQWIATRESANTAKDALVKIQRPWVGIEGEPQPINPNESLGAGYYVIVKNFGRGPALHIGAVGDTSSTIPTPKQFKEKCTKAISQTIVNGREEGAYLLPGNTFPQRVIGDGITLQINTSAQAESTQPANPAAMVKPGFLYGCITYKDQFDNSVQHHSTFCFTAGRCTSGLEAN